MAGITVEELGLFMGQKLREKGWLPPADAESLRTALAAAERRADEAERERDAQRVRAEEAERKVSGFERFVPDLNEARSRAAALASRVSALAADRAAHIVLYGAVRSLATDLAEVASAVSASRGLDQGRVYSALMSIVHRLRHEANNHAPMARAALSAPAPESTKPEWQGDPAHIQFVAATVKQITAFNMNPGRRWVVYFEDPATGARAQTFAVLTRFPGVSAAPAPGDATAPRCRCDAHVPLVGLSVTTDDGVTHTAQHGCYSCAPAAGSPDAKGGA